MKYLTRLRKLKVSKCEIAVNTLNNYSFLTYLDFKMPPELITGNFLNLTQLICLTNLKVLCYENHTDIFDMFQDHRQFIYLQKLKIENATMYDSTFNVCFPNLTTLVNLNLQTNLLKLTVRYLRVLNLSDYIKNTSTLRKLYLVERNEFGEFNLSRRYNKNLEFLKLVNFQRIRLYGQFSDLKTNDLLRIIKTSIHSESETNF